MWIFFTIPNEISTYKSSTEHRVNTIRKCFILDLRRTCDNTWRISILSNLDEWDHRCLIPLFSLPPSRALFRWQIRECLVYIKKELENSSKIYSKFDPVCNRQRSWSISFNALCDGFVTITYRSWITDAIECLCSSHQALEDIIPCSALTIMMCFKCKCGIYFPPRFIPLQRLPPFCFVCDIPRRSF